MSETDVGMAGFNDRTQLGHCLWRWFRPMRKDYGRIVIDRQNFAAKFHQPTRDKSRTSTVTTIDRNLQATRLNGVSVKSICQQIDVVCDRILVLDSGFDLVPGRFGKLSLMKNV